MAAPGAWHPAILKHPANGRATLYLGRRRNSYVEGYSRDESDALLEALWAHVTQPRFVYQHVWRLGDLVMWDNRSTMHRRDPFDGEARRIMHRTQIKGSDRACGLRGLNRQEQSEETCGGRRSSMPGAMPTRT